MMSKQNKQIAMEQEAIRKADQLGAEWYAYELGVLIFRDEFGLYSYVDWDGNKW